jgi:hypothetical protein
MAPTEGTDPEQQYTGDGERENPEQQLPDIGSGTSEVPTEQPADRPDTDDGP